MSIYECTSKTTRQEFIQEYIMMHEGAINKGKISDGYHTFDELYYHRTVLFACLCKAHKDRSFISEKHSNGTMFDDMCIAGMYTPEGIYTYHCEKKYWDLFKGVQIFDSAPIWDGHQPDDVSRLSSIDG